MNDINKQQQAAVAAHQNAQQQQAAAQQAQMQQQVEGQTIQVQQVQIAHDGSDQMHATGAQVASTNAAMNQPSAMVMQTPQQALISQQAMSNIHSPPGLTPIHSQAGSTTITTMSTGPQQMAEWAGHGRVQVIQQPIQNPTYIQPVYNGQGQLIVPGNIALHPGNINQPIQVITAGKAFQPGQMPHMLTTTQGKPIVQGQTTSFPGYTTIPTSGNNQTLVISQLGVLGQTNLLPQQQGKPQEMQKMIAKNNVGNATIKATPTQQQNVSIGNLVSSQPQGMTTQAQTIIQPQILSPIQYTCNTQQQRAVPQATTPAMQFAPWQATFGPTGLPQGLTWAPGAIQSSALLTQSSQIFIRNPHPDQPGMFIHNAQPSAIPQHNQMQGQPINKTNQTIELGGNVQPKTAITKTFSTILPNSMGPQQIRPASSVSTQTGQTQTIHQSNFQMKGVSRVRTKNVCRMPSMATAPKVDGNNQIKTVTTIPALQPKYVISNAQPGTTVHITQDKLIKPAQTVTQQSPSQQQQQQQPQPLAQIQQMQSMFSDSIETKPTGQILVTSGVQNGGAAVVPVSSMPPGQMTPVMTTMVAQNVPGIPPMSPETSVPLTPSTPISSVNQEIITSTPLIESIKEEALPVKDTNAEESKSTETGPGRPEEAVSGAGDSVTLRKTEKAQPQKTDTSEKEKSEEDKENKKVIDKEGALGQPKATMMVKPQVLTHVIEGFVIQESSEPFPVNRGCADGLIRKMPVGETLENGEPPRKKSLMEGGKDKEMATCETCGKKDLKSKFKKSKRFCSMSCAKRFNVGCSSRVSLFSREDDKGAVESETNESSEEVSAPTKKEGDEGQIVMGQENENKINPLQWSVAEVCEFIKTLPGCAEYVEDFALQDIDGEALMLLKPDHLMSVMSMKLGPAVKIIAKIDTMRNGETSPAN